MNLKFYKPLPSRQLEQATKNLLSALLRYPVQLPDNLKSISPDRAKFCGTDGATIIEILAQYEKVGAYSIASVAHATKRKDLTQIAGLPLDADLGFYCEVWSGEYCNWAYLEGLNAASGELISTGTHSEAVKAQNEVLQHLKYDLQAQTETNWREETNTRVENKLNGVVSNCKTKNTVPGWMLTVPEFEPGLIYVVAARPGMGKTQVLLKALQGFEAQGAKGCVWTLEMPGLQLAERILAAMAQVNPKADWSQLSENKKQRIRECRDIIINANYDFKEGNNLRELKTTARQLHKQGQLDYLMLDYLGLMNTGDTYRDRDDNKRISDITRELKSLAKELKIPIIELSQLNRELEKRANRRPQLSDLRDSGAVEQDADVVTFIYRDEYYGILEDAQGRSTVGIAEFITAKYRNGAPGTAIGGFHPVMGFVFTEEEMRSTEQAKIINAIATRDHQMPDSEPEWVQSKQTAKPNRNDEDIPF